MTLSALHEEILDDIRFIGDIYDELGYTVNDFWSLTEACLANLFGECVGLRLNADAYLFPNDGGGPIMVEIGKMQDGKWSGVIASDSRPVRVLRVGFDRTIWLLNSRKTAMEEELLAYFERKLSTS